MALKQKLIPLFDRVIIEPKIEKKEKNKAGIILPETETKERPGEGVVIAVGMGRWDEDGQRRIPLSVKVGDTVLFSKYGPDEIIHEGKTYLILREDQILAVIK